MGLKIKVVNFIILALKFTPWLSSALYKFSNIYIDTYRDFSYDSTKNGEHEIIIRALKTYNKKIVFFDVGANVGDWTKFMISNARSFKGHLFELSTDTFATLKNNLKNYQSENLVLNNFGLSDKAGEIEFKDYGRDNGGNTILLNASYHKKQYSISKATIETGDSYIQELGVSRINFLKIDTEGSEFFVLNGFKKAFKNKIIDIVQFEYGYTHGDAKTLMQDFFHFFEQNGYIVGRLTPHGVMFKTFEYTDNDFKSGPNYIACLPEYQKHLNTRNSRTGKSDV